MQGVLGIGRIQGRRAAIELIGLEAIPGALGALGRPKEPASLILGSEEGRKNE